MSFAPIDTPAAGAAPRTDAAWLDGEHFVCGDRGVSESTFRGSKADGTRIEARMVDIFTFQNGKILIKNAFRKDRPPVSIK